MSYRRTPGLPCVDEPEPPAPILPVAPAGEEDLSRLCDSARSLLAATGATELVCDASALPPDLAAVNALARLELTARRAGARIVVRDPDPLLRNLLELVGLPLQMEGQIEQREPPGRVEEGRDLHDPAR